MIARRGAKGNPSGSDSECRPLMAGGKGIQLGSSEKLEMYQD